MNGQVSEQFWRRLPPAVFPPILGLVGLALAWIRAGQVFGFGPWPGRIILIVVFVLYVFLTGAYIAKFMARPGVLWQDLGTMSGRLGLSALTLSGMLLAAGLAPMMPLLAKVLLFGGLAAHTALLVCVVLTIKDMPGERLVTPAWHLSFVGFIVAPFAALELGLTALAVGIPFASMIVALTIYAVSADMWKAHPHPEPARPLMAIHLTPVSIFATVAMLLHLEGTAVVMGIMASLFFLALLANARWLTCAGFTPAWAAFTFPLTAYAGMLLTLAPVSGLFAWAGLMVLLFASTLVPWIAGRILGMWAAGRLTPATGAAIA